MRAFYIGALTAVLFNPAAFAREHGQWPDDAVGRLEVQALIEELNGQLLASASATTTLEKWCGDHGMAEPPRLVAHSVPGAALPASEQDRLALEVGPNAPLGYRRVELRCGDRVLSEADNWYVPARLSAAMRLALTGTETPFGRVIKPLKPTRQTLSVERLWSPLPEGWERGPLPQESVAPGLLAIPVHLFRHRAVVYDSRHRPLALVVETYTREILDF